jgi:hypothetical protein
MRSVTRTLAIAAILPLMAACTPVTAAMLDITPVGANSRALAHGFDSNFPGLALWVMLILATVHLGVSLRCGAAARRLEQALAKRRASPRRR